MEFLRKFIRNIEPKKHVPWIPTGSDEVLVLGDVSHKHKLVWLAWDQKLGKDATDFNMENATANFKDLVGCNSCEYLKIVSHRENF